MGRGMRVVVLNWAEGGARGWGRVAGVGDAERWLWGAGAMAIGGTPIGGARSGRFVRIGAVSFGELIVGVSICGVLICGVLIMVWAALAVVRLGRGEIAARGFRSGTTEWRSWQSEANAAAMAPSSACSTRSMRINADQRQCFLRSFYSRAHRRRTHANQVVSRFRSRCELCWRAGRNGVRELLLLAPVSFQERIA
jgi:hypothetical protein